MSSFTSSRSMASSGQWMSFIALSLDHVAKSVRGVLDCTSGASKIRQGGVDHSVPLQSELGERRYTKLCEDESLTLEEIHYCQEGLGGVSRTSAQGDVKDQETGAPGQGELKRQMKDLINHDYLVLKLRPGDPTAEVVHIMAEKDQDGIHIEYIPSSDVTSYVHEDVHCFTVACRKKRIRLEALVAILKEENPGYNLFYANCWFYAQRTAKRLVKACIETPGISSEEKARLQTEHDNLQPKLIFQHFHNVIQSLRLRASPSG